MEILLRMRYLSMIILYKKTRNKRFWAKVFSPSSLNNKHNVCCSGERRFARRKKHLLLSHVSRTSRLPCTRFAFTSQMPPLPCKTLKMQANCYPPPPKRTTSYPLTSVVLEMKDYFHHEQANLLPSRASLWELHHSPTRKPLSEEELRENEAGCNRSFFLFSSWTTEYSVDNTLPKAISTHVCIITGH